MVHSKTGLLLAISDDLPGLNAMGRTMDELLEEIPVVIKSLLEARGASLVTVVMDEPAKAPHGFEARYRTFRAHLEAV